MIHSHSRKNADSHGFITITSKFQTWIHYDIEHIQTHFFQVLELDSLATDSFEMIRSHRLKQQHLISGNRNKTTKLNQMEGDSKFYLIIFTPFHHSKQCKNNHPYEVTRIRHSQRLYYFLIYDFAQHIYMLA